MNPQQCWNHTLNKSGSKYAFKFSKSNRFKDPVLLTHTIYKVESRNQKKGCGFGFGDRPSLAKRGQTPSPQNYNLPSSISNKAKTFGSSRKNTVFRWFLQGAAKNASRPGPDAYCLPSSLEGRKYSLGTRLPTDIDISLKKRGPAPNKYNLQAAGSPASGKYASSQYKNTRKIIFFGRQTPVQKSLNVGPGSYNIVHNYESLDDKQFRKTCKTFGTSDRPGPADKSKKNFPGPGLYDTFSQFPSQAIIS